MRKHLITMLFAAGVALGARVETRADFVPGRVYGTRSSGCEMASFASVSSYAEENHIPLVVILGNKGCPHCTKLQTELRTGVSSELPVIFYNEFSEGRDVFSSDAFCLAEEAFAEGSPTLTTLYCKWTRDDGTTISRTKCWGQICNGTYVNITTFADVERFAAELFDSSYVQLACGIPDSPKPQLQIVSKGSPIGDLPVPSRRGFSFAGWFTAKTGGDKVMSDYVVVDDLTLYARWLPADITFGKKWYEALADDEGVTCVGWKNFYMGANVAIPVTVTDADGESVVLTADDITVKPGTYIDYGTPYVLSEAEMWETYGRPLFDVRNSGWRIDLEKDGGVWVYNNWDWEDEADFTYELEKGIWPFFDDDYSDDSDVDIWLDAHGDRQWIVIPTGTRPQKGTHTFTVQVSIGGNSAKCPVSFIMSPDQKAKAATVRFNANGGMVSEYGRVVNLNAAIGTLPVPEARRGYTFKGWFTAKTKGTKITAATKVTKAMALYAQWTAKKYKVYVEAEGGKVVGAGWHATGSKVKLTMIPGKNRKFGSWGLDFLDFNGNGQWDEEWSESVWDDGEGYYISDAEKSIWEKCEKSMSTMWNPTLTFTMPPCDVYLSTIAWTKKEEKAHGLDSSCTIPNPWCVADCSEAEVWLPEVYTLASFSANKTIPAGMKLVRKSDYSYILKVADASKLPAGVKKVKFTVTTRWGYKATETLTVILPNRTQAVDAGALALQHLDSHDYYTLKAGVKNQWDTLGIQALGGWTLSSVTGIPGLTWDAKNKKMKGVPSKKGLYTATFTVTKGKAKKVATANFKIEALPANVVGTFHGYTMKPVDSCCEDDSPLLGKKSRKVTVTSGSDGKITAKIGSDTIALTGWTLEDGLYKVRYMKNVEKKDKKYTGITKTEFEVAIDPGAAWDEDAVTGTFYYYDGWSIPNCISCNTPAKYTKYTLRDEVFCARKNAAATSGDAKTIAAEYAKLGKQSFIVHKAPSGSGYAYDLWCPNCVADVETFEKTLFAKTEPNGKVTLSGTIAGTKVSGVTYLAYEHRRHWYYDEWEDEWDFYEAFEAVARFFVGKFVIEIWGPADSESLEYYLPSNGTLWGCVWKK